ncbi:MAG TPA: MmcQ/YjbR family DNA-binding protein [Aeromicrobium sp.]|nr:MmcQ/YjbR family DNA-binding protein [Aeromicrobium sp.]
MSTIDDVGRIAMTFPNVTEKLAWGNRTWRVDDKTFVWDRPLREKDRAELGAAAPDGPTMGVHTEDHSEKQALLAADPDVFFTISHFDKYAMVLVRLDAVDTERLTEIIEDAWLSRAPRKLAAEYLAD